MKVSGLLSIIAIVLMVYCACDSTKDQTSSTAEKQVTRLEVEQETPPVEQPSPVPEKVDAENKEEVIPPPSRPMGVDTSYFEGPFGVDSQTILNSGAYPSYVIGIVTKVNLEKNDDGTWYVEECELSNVVLPYPYGNGSGKNLFFTSPYPQQNDLKKGDFIGFSARINVFSGSRFSNVFFTRGKMVDNISSQSVNCQIDNITELSVPAKKWERLGTVTGVIMAVQIRKNSDPEPDNPSDYFIHRAVMKCGDGNLYLVDFERHNTASLSEKPVNQPDPDAFGEGDVVTVTHLGLSSLQTQFKAYYYVEE